MKIPQPEQVMQMSPLRIYRLLLKFLPQYPSIRRASIRTSVIEEFKTNQNLKDEKEIKKQQKMAALGLAHVLLNVQKNLELQMSLNTAPTNYEQLNPKNDDFVYFQLIFMKLFV